jgi:hypothetical protein
MMMMGEEEREEEEERGGRKKAREAEAQKRTGARGGQGALGLEWTVDGGWTGRERALARSGGVQRALPGCVIGCGAVEGAALSEGFARGGSSLSLTTICGGLSSSLIQHTTRSTLTDRTGISRVEALQRGENRFTTHCLVVC